MAKKSKGRNKQTSARGHVEGNVIRFREKTELIRVDREGNPLTRGAPINTFDRNWLSGKLLSDISAPPSILRRNPPSNVTSIDSGRKPEKSKPVSQTGNEAEAIAPVTSGNKHGWLHDKSLAIGEFRHWSRMTKELGRPAIASEVWTKDAKGKLHSKSLEQTRAAAQNGHKGIVKLRFKSPPNINHNPFIKPDATAGYASKKVAAPICVLNERNRSRDAVVYTPSGLPISEFITGKYKPKNAVVYTTQSELPPTPTRDWRASNDRQYEPTHLNEWARKTNGLVQWFINHVEVQNWSPHIHQYVTWLRDGPVVNTGAINKAASHPETELLLVQSLNQGLEKDWRMIDSALADVTSENNLLRQELELTKQELKHERQANSLMEYHIAQSNGVDPDIVRDAYVKPKTPDVPDDADVMLAQFNVFSAFVRCDGLEHAFARYVYGDPRLGEVIRDHADMRCNQRQSDVGYRNLVRTIKGISDHILSEMQAEYEQQKYTEYVDFWNKQYPLYLLHRQRRNTTAVREPYREAVAYAAMSRKAKPATHRSSLYYSTLDNRKQYLSDAVAKHILSKVQPCRVRYNNPRLVEHDSRNSWAQPAFKGVSKYEQWWAERIDYCEVRYHEIKHPAKVAVVKTYNKIVELLNSPVDPATRSRHKQLREQMKSKQRALDEKREQRREDREAAKQRKAEREHIRKMQRLAH